jgi:hypothetical protein
MASSNPNAQILDGHFPTLQRLQTTQGPRDLSHWQAENEILPKHKMHGAQEKVLSADPWDPPSSPHPLQRAGFP